MSKLWSLALLSALLVHLNIADMEPGSVCPPRCQCFRPSQVLCADERMTFLPQNVSRAVREVIIMTSGVEYLFPNLFRENPRLEKLILFNNVLRSVHSQAFQQLAALQELEISGNPWLDHLFLDTFSRQTNLTALALNYNRLKVILPGMFDNLKSLRSLQMKGNALTFLPTLLFSGLRRLAVLDVSLNKLEEVTGETFSGLVQLEVLRLSGNNISGVTSDTFADVGGLRELHLDGNFISKLGGGVFSGLPQLTVLNLRGNRLTAFPGDLFGQGGANLKELNLKGNRLRELSPLSVFSSLSHLVLSSNQLKSLPEDTFRNLSALHFLDLSENHFTMLPETVFRNLSNIKFLHLQKNLLDHLEAGVFEDQESMEQLYLSDNRLKSLPTGLLDSFGLQHVVRLHGNPWNCDCHLEYLHGWVRNNSRGVEMLDRMTCEGPGLLRRRTVASVHDHQLVCRTSEDRVSRCSLRSSADSVVVKCHIDKGSPMRVRVLFEDSDGDLQEHIVRTGVTGDVQTNVSKSEE